MLATPILGGLCITMDMFRRRRSMRRMAAPITSVKNQAATKQSILASTVIQDFIATSVEVGEPTKVTGKEVPVGAQIYRIAVSVNFISATASSTGNFDWCLMKLREGQSVSTTIVSPDWTNIGLSKARNQVVKSFMTIFATEDAGAAKYNLSIKIPKIYQRMRSGDLWVIVAEASDAGSLSTGMRYKYFI